MRPAQTDNEEGTGLEVQQPFLPLIPSPVPSVASAAVHRTVFHPRTIARSVLVVAKERQRERERDKKRRKGGKKRKY